MQFSNVPAFLYENITKYAKKVAITNLSLHHHVWLLLNAPGTASPSFFGFLQTLEHIIESSEKESIVL